jgi:EmrB/QacA subfamily drug resistance transporter
VGAVNTQHLVPLEQGYRLSESQESNGNAIATAAGRNVPAGLVLLLVCLGQFMVVLDLSIVNVALPSMQRDLGFSTSGLQWVVNAYTLTFAGFLLLGGRAADLYGRRRIFILGLSLFTGASLLGGLSQTQGMLVAARALQGLGGAVLAPATLTILTTSFREPAARARALGVWSAVAAGGGAAGALLGGILTDLISWRWILFVNVPVGVLVIIGSLMFLGETKGEVKHRSLDLAGSATVTAGLVSLVFAIVRTENYAWSSPQVLAPFALAVILLAAFLFIETRVAKAPLVPMRIFQSRSVTGANVFIALFIAAIFPTWYFQTLYMQNVLGYSPLKAGLVFLPMTIMIAVGAQVSSRAVTRVGARTLLIAGPALSALGLAWLTGVSPSSSFFFWLLLPSLFVTFGMGLSFPASTLAATAGIAPHEQGLASGLLNTNRQVGGSIGLAALATVAADRTHAVLASGSSAGVHDALTSGYTFAFGIAAVVCAGAAVAAGLILPTARRRERVAVLELERKATPSMAGEPGLEVEGA